MKVYVAHRGCYENRSVAGIFDTPERAIAAMPGSTWRKTTWTSFRNRTADGGPDLTSPSHYSTWDNDLDWDDAVSIEEMEIVTDGPERGVDAAVVQTYRPSDGGWDYVPEILDT